jgi:predicted aspartyl protease
VVERSVPALVVPRGQAKNNLLGLSFLDRLESWEVRNDRMTIRGYP